MTEEEIKTAFFEALLERGVGKKLGVTRYVVYNYRNRETNTAKMLEVLWKLDKLELKIE